LHYRWPDLPGPQIEERMEAKKQAVFAFAEANPIDRRIYDIPTPPSVSSPPARAIST
jgi:indolepyruvate ferredoxin oxidoreductase